MFVLCVCVLCLCAHRGAVETGPGASDGIGGGSAAGVNCCNDNMHLVE